ncbi:hypothetical protein A9G24_01245 [Gilliamella sp. App6-5]|jgi:hypothetical protein|uniref:hypothetical protein n=1 Tax=Gilliamella sp. App6-5 TaxID=3120232 RepID=UPI00080DFBEE|nr:hypothetical protein [Gilliamella apicola]OCG15999.1 hypothetical protein A9G24_01245 [Gilliamella apicola]
MKLIVKREDLIAARQCSSGGRAFFKRHGLDWSDFLKNGIDAEILIKINDVMANQVIEQARRRIWAEAKRNKQ